MRSHIDKLRSIVENDYCIGCGVCSYLAPTHARIDFDVHGKLTTVIDWSSIKESEAISILRVCPFSNSGPDENALGSYLFPYSKFDPIIGYYSDLFMGYSELHTFRHNGASGGITTWLLTMLLNTGAIDGVIHVTADHHHSDRLFSYNISYTTSEILEGAKSKYYPVELSEILQQVLSTTNKYALVGLPCFVKAVRRLSAIDVDISSRILFFIGLVCGHLKSKSFADCIAWQVGIQPGDLSYIDFRARNSEDSSKYSFRIKGGDIDVTAPSSRFFCANWAYGFFKYKACDYCDDVFNETADVSIGDAWIPTLAENQDGNSIIIVRSKKMHSLLTHYSSIHDISLSPLSPSTLYKSQAGGIRHKRSGLAYRILHSESSGDWCPSKRVDPSDFNISRNRARIYNLRILLFQESHKLWRESVESNSFQYFVDSMAPLIRKYNRTNVSLTSRIFNKFRTFLSVLS